jgi:hypothetical protein
LTGGSEGSADDGVDGRVFVCVGENTGNVMSVEVLILLEKHTKHAIASGAKELRFRFSWGVIGLQAMPRAPTIPATPRETPSETPSLTPRLSLGLSSRVRVRLVLTQHGSLLPS